MFTGTFCNRHVSVIIMCCDSDTSILSIHRHLREGIPNLNQIIDRVNLFIVFTVTQKPFIAGVKELTRHCIGTRSRCSSIHFLVIIPIKGKIKHLLNEYQEQQGEMVMHISHKSVNLKLLPFGKEHWGYWMSQRDTSQKSECLYVKGQYDTERKQPICLTQQYHYHPNRCKDSFSTCVEMFFLRQRRHPETSIRMRRHCRALLSFSLRSSNELKLNNSINYH